MERLIWMLAAATLALAAVACGGDDDDGPGDDGGANGDDGGSASLEVASDDFDDGGEIAVEFTCDGRGLSPHLGWDGEPGDTESFAILMDDLDADFVHWTVYNIDADSSGVETIGQQEVLFGGPTTQGMNSFGEIGYGGPCPPEGESHTYRFRVFALDTMVDLEPGASADELETAMEGRVLAEGETTGVYSR